MGYILDPQGQLIPKLGSGRNPNSPKILCIFFIACKSKKDRIDSTKKDRIDSNEAKGKTSFLLSRGAYFVVSGLIMPQFELIQALYMSSVPSSIKRIGSKTNEKMQRHRVPPL